MIHRLGHLRQERRDRLDCAVHRLTGALGLRRVAALDKQDHGISRNKFLDEFLPGWRHDDRRQKRPLRVVRCGGGELNRSIQFAIRRPQQAHRHARRPLGQALGLRGVALGQVDQFVPNIGIAEQYRRRLAKAIHLPGRHLAVNETEKRVLLAAQVRKADVPHRVPAGLGGGGGGQRPG